MRESVPTKALGAALGAVGVCIAVGVPVLQAGLRSDPEFWGAALRVFTLVTVGVLAASGAWLRFSSKSK